MLASQNFELGIGDKMYAKWYEDVEGCFNDSEVIPGTYEYKHTTSWGNVVLFQKMLLQISHFKQLVIMLYH